MEQYGKSQLKSDYTHNHKKGAKRIHNTLKSLGLGKQSTTMSSSTAKAENNNSRSDIREMGKGKKMQK